MRRLGQVAVRQRHADLEQPARRLLALVSFARNDMSQMIPTQWLLVGCAGALVALILLLITKARVSTAGYGQALALI